MENLNLGIESIDQKHDEFLELLEQLKKSSKAEFLEGFHAMIEHTKAHFAFEESLMRAQNYYGLQEHLDEHNNLLGEMRYFFEKSHKSDTLGRAYINDYAYEKFKRHIINIDSQLAQFLKSSA